MRRSVTAHQLWGGRMPYLGTLCLFTFCRLSHEVREESPYQLRISRHCYQFGFGNRFASVQRDEFGQKLDLRIGDAVTPYAALLTDGVVGIGSQRLAASSLRLMRCLTTPTWLVDFMPRRPAISVYETPGFAVHSSNTCNSCAESWAPSASFSSVSRSANAASSINSFLSDCASRFSSRRATSVRKSMRSPQAGGLSSYAAKASAGNSLSRRANPLSPSSRRSSIPARRRRFVLILMCVA